MLENSTKRFIHTWLSIILLMVLSMILIGGVTRLTDSGLSMVEWKPLLGVIPPMSEVEWNIVFDKYKQFPEYQIVNQRMNLSEFKFIYFWEYFHRLFGRLIGLVFFFPLAFLLIRKKLNVLWRRRLILAFFLGGSQGLLGWFMVKSGLVDKPDVSHFRLAAHFSLALIIMSYIYWLMMKIKQSVLVKDTDKSHVNLMPFSMLLIVQIIYGAFVAGLDAGMVFNTFPLMGNSLVPPGLFASGIEGFISGNAGVQFVHRVIGVSLLICAILLLRKAKNIKNRKEQIALKMMSHMTFLQFALGVSTLIYKVPLVLGSLHQMGACVLVLFTVRAIFIFAPYKVEKEENRVLKENIVLT